MWNSTLWHKPGAPFPAWGAHDFNMHCWKEEQWLAIWHCFKSLLKGYNTLKPSHLAFNFPFMQHDYLHSAGNQNWLQSRLRFLKEIQHCQKLIPGWCLLGRTFGVFIFPSLQCLWFDFALFSRYSMGSLGFSAEAGPRLNDRDPA